MEGTLSLNSVEIEHRIRKVIADELKVAESEVKEDATIADLGGDSLAALVMISAIELKFNLRISDEDAAKMTSIKTASEVVGRLVSEAHFSSYHKKGI